MPHCPSASSALPFVLQAAQLELDQAQLLARHIELVDLAGRLIHALQRERGSSSLFLASRGLRCGPLRLSAVAAARPVETLLRAHFDAELPTTAAGQRPMGSVRLLSLIAWVLLGLDSLDDLRERVARQELDAHACVSAYSRLIAGLLELIFDIAQSVALPGVSRLTVSFLHLVQGSELAGQERAVGAELFGAGRSDAALQQRVLHLIDAQERSLQVCADFAEADLRERLERQQLSPAVARLERLRRSLCSAQPGSALDSQLSDSWFEVSSERINELWQIQVELAARLHQDCAQQLRLAQQGLLDAQQLLARLQSRPPRHVDAVGRFFDTAVPAGQAPTLAEAPPAHAQGAPGPAGDPSLVELLQAQADRLAQLEAELQAARRTLDERKVIERAKGALMSRLGMSEDEALRALQKTSMDQNRRLLDVAQATLSLPDFAFGRHAATPPSRPHPQGSQRPSQ